MPAYHPPFPSAHVPPTSLNPWRRRPRDPESTLVLQLTSMPAVDRRDPEFVREASEQQRCLPQ